MREVSQDEERRCSEEEKKSLKSDHGGGHISFSPSVTLPITKSQLHIYLSTCYGWTPGIQHFMSLYYFCVLYQAEQRGEGWLGAYTSLALHSRYLLPTWQQAVMPAVIYGVIILKFPSFLKADLPSLLGRT